MYCTKCGNEVPKGYKFCPKCGAKLVVPMAENQAKPDPERAQAAGTRGTSTGSASTGQKAQWA